MKKVGLLYREKIVDELKERWSQANARIFVGFTKVGAFPFNRLRNELRKEDIRLLVVKNSLAIRALKDIDAEDTGDFINDSIGLVFVGGQDVVKVCKILVGFSKENEGFSLKGGFLQEKKLSVYALESLSKLPPRTVLLSTAVMTMAAPLIGFVATLNNVLLKFVWLVNELEKKRSSS